MRDFFTKDIGWKIFSFGLAVILYFTVRAVRQSSGDTGRPLEARATHSYRGVPVLVMSSASDVREFKVNPAVVQVSPSFRKKTSASPWTSPGLNPHGI